ncbi:hypothetical protein ACFQV2_37895 [Actinokineospora soli]|uniref:Uncharacterized protein n=1 Tax=Actinokineospora soli TaxID=1048753 RepID=A0ABW2TZT4_9PSEU
MQAAGAARAAVAVVSNMICGPVSTRRFAATDGCTRPSTTTSRSASAAASAPVAMSGAGAHSGGMDRPSSPTR